MKRYSKKSSINKYRRRSSWRIIFGTKRVKFYVKIVFYTCNQISLFSNFLWNGLNRNESFLLLSLFYLKSILSLTVLNFFQKNYERYAQYNILFFFLSLQQMQCNQMNPIRRKIDLWKSCVKIRIFQGMDVILFFFERMYDKKGQGRLRKAGRDYERYAHIIFSSFPYLYITKCSLILVK